MCLPGGAEITTTEPGIAASAYMIKSINYPQDSLVLNSQNAQLE
jgi:hypothetical protein